MSLVLTRRAARQLDAILDQIAGESPQGARRVQARLQSIFLLLRDQPMAGQATDRPGVRRLAMSPFPYVIFYRVRGDDVVVQRVRHGARRPIT